MGFIFEEQSQHHAQKNGKYRTADDGKFLSQEMADYRQTEAEEQAFPDCRKFFHDHSSLEIVPVEVTTN